MPGFTPSAVVSVPTEAEIWAYIARTLTDPDSYKADVSALALEATSITRSIALLTAMGLIPTTPELEATALTRYNVLTNEEHETEWVSNPVVVNVASVALTTLTEHLIPAATFVYPVGAVERRVILLAMISAQAQASATHHIGVKLQMEVNDGGWADLLDLTANPPLGLSAEASMGNLTLPRSISTLVANGDKLEFRFQVDSDNAASVNYTTSFVVVLVYRMAT